MPSAESLTLLVNSFHRLGSTDEECCERTGNLQNEFCFLQSSKFQNSFFGTFLPTNFQFIWSSETIQDFFGNISNIIPVGFGKYRYVSMQCCNIWKHYCRDTVEQIYRPCFLSNAKLVKQYWCNSWCLQMSIPRKSLQSGVWCRLRESFAVSPT